ALSPAYAHRRRLVPLLRRPRAQARRLLRPDAAPDQRRRGADRLLLRRAESLLRHVLRHEDPVLTVALAAVAALAGLTGTWSPCGFSMIETIGGPGRRVGTSCAAFATGAVAGGVATFGLLAAAGQAVRSAGAGGLLAAAAAIAVVGALGELRGAAISPQIRRQVP